MGASLPDGFWREWWLALMPTFVGLYRADAAAVKAVTWALTTIIGLAAATFGVALKFPQFDPCKPAALWAGGLALFCMLMRASAIAGRHAALAVENTDPPLAELLVQQRKLASLASDAADLANDLREIHMGGFQVYGEKLLAFGDRVLPALSEAWAAGDARRLEFYVDQLRERLKPTTTGSRDFDFLHRTLQEIDGRIAVALLGVEQAIERAPSPHV